MPVATWVAVWAPWAIYRHFNQSPHPQWFSNGLSGALLTVGPLAFLFYLVRGAYIIGLNRPDGTFSLAWKIMVALVLPVLGLLVNKELFLDGLGGGTKNGTSGDFSSPWFFGLAVLNGVLLCCPAPARPGWHLALLAGRSVLLGYMAYFFLVFLPFLPLSVLAVVAIGTGFLMLTPLVVLVVHIRALDDDAAALGNTARGPAPAPGATATPGGTVVYVGAAAKQRRPLMQRRPYYHFLLDVSAGKAGRKPAYKQWVTRFLQARPGLGAPRFTLVNTCATPVPAGRDWQSQLDAFPNAGGCYLTGAVQRVLADAQLHPAPSYPVLVVVTGSLAQAVLAPDFADLAPAYPEGDGFLVLVPYGAPKPARCATRLRRPWPPPGPRPAGPCAPGPRPPIPRPTYPTTACPP
ncbi:hypothetical protein [Hymenobacter nivis]|uniref:Uncharacterized protein n=1 Tax=Hymenobacter nivis TaxID=1850093 RepID=A0A2Z3GYA7_9BACT|nr:hypothetical protein [Hymenobacter nivis]AWM34384.1 hypothetical protein DDQ68_17285 [Hymenobacter nivis]